MLSIEKEILKRSDCQATMATHGASIVATRASLRRMFVEDKHDPNKRVNRLGPGSREENLVLVVVARARPSDG